MSSDQKIKSQTNEVEKKKENVYIKDFKIIKRIGFGSSGLVYKVTKKDDPKNQIYILKQIPYSEPNLEETTKKVQSAQNEAIILSKLSCKYIVKYYGSFIDEDYNLNIIMEYCDSGDLNSFICNLKKENKYLTEKEIWFYFIQISLGLAYIHSKNILHRDLKPMNIFLTNKNQIKIGDLGVAKLLSTNTNAQTCIGTPYYLSPEICKEKPYNSKGDVWALGCILYELSTFNKPFVASNPAALILKIINGKYTPLDEVKNGQKYSKELQLMIDNILQKDYLVRPLMKDIINSDIFTEKCMLYGFEEDLRNIKSLYSNDNENIYNINQQLYGKLMEKQLNDKLINNSNIYSDKKQIELNNKKNVASHKKEHLHEKNSKKVPVVHSIRTKKNYISTGRSTIDSSQNYDKGNFINNSNALNYNELNSKNSTNNQNEYLYSTKNRMKADSKTKPTTKYIKYIIKNNQNNNNNNNNNNKKKQSIYNKNNLNNQNKENLLDLKLNRSNKLRMFQISPSHFRNSSGGRYNNKNISLINKDNYYRFPSKNKVNNSNEKKYIYKTKNIMTSHNFYNSNNNNKNYLEIFQNKKIMNNKMKTNKTETKLINKNRNIKINNIQNIKNENISENSKNLKLLKKNRNDFKSSENIIHNSKEKQNDINVINYLNSFDKKNLNHLKNLNINYSLNLIEKTRINFYNKNFSGMHEPIEVMKTQTQNNFNNLNNFRIENGLEDINNDNNNNSNNNFEIINSNINLNKSQDSSEEHNHNYFDDEIIEDSGQEDEDDEEKVSIVREKNSLQKEKNNKQKEEYIQKYNEYKNKILQYKNIIDIHELFSLYEKMSKDKSKNEDYTKEIEDYMKNNLNKDVYQKFRKLFKEFIYYDIKIQDLSSS